MVLKVISSFARSVGVRTPMMKRVIYDEVGTIEAEMKTRTNKARTGMNYVSKTVSDYLTFKAVLQKSSLVWQF